MGIRYLVLTTDDAARIAAELSRTGALPDIAARLRDDTGADMEQIVSWLKRLDICGACAIEGQEAHCSSLVAQTLGRRLGHLLERARGERGPGSPDGSPDEAKVM